MVISIHFDKEYLKKRGIKMVWIQNRLVAIIPSSYKENEVYKVDVEALAKRKREIFAKWHENSMENCLIDMIYDEFPYDVANFAIYGIEVF